MGEKSSRDMEEKVLWQIIMRLSWPRWVGGWRSRKRMWKKSAKNWRKLGRKCAEFRVWLIKIEKINTGSSGPDSSFPSLSWESATSPTVKWYLSYYSGIANPDNPQNPFRRHDSSLWRYGQFAPSLTDSFSFDDKHISIIITPPLTTNTRGLSN